MCLEFGNTGKKFQYDDILRVANQVSGTDMGDFFSNYVAGKKELLPLSAILCKAGLRLNHFVDEHYLSRLDNPTPLQSSILAGLLGEGK
jgi:predicted metalloprotease with PDZ domain